MLIKHAIGILGVGAIGSALAFALQQNRSNQFYYFSRTGKDDLRVISEDIPYEIPIRIITSISTPPPHLDWLLICLKEYHYTAALDWFPQLIRPATKVAVIRNGLRLKDPILPFAKAANILECMIDCPVQPVEEGYYKMFGKPVVTVPHGPLATDFSALFANTEVKVKTTADFKSEGWQKLCTSAALGAILCLSGATCWIFQDEQLWELYAGLLQESILVARADGAKLPNDFHAQAMARLRTYPPDKGSSMLTDRLRGNPIELGAKNGLISQLGKELQIPTPLHDLVVLLLTYTNKRSTS